MTGAEAATTVGAALVGRVRQRFARDGAAATSAAVVAAVREQPGAAALGDTTLLQLAQQVHADLVGAGPLAPLLADPEVTDVLVNHDQVWVDRGRGLTRAPLRIGTAEEVRRLAQRLVAAGGRRLDDSAPCADVRLPDGTRLHAVLPPVATAGPYLSLRTFRQRPSPRRPGRRRRVRPRRRRVARRDRRGPADLSGHRRHRHRQDHPARDPARWCRAPSGSWWWRTRPSCGCATPTWSPSQARTANVEGAGAVDLRDLVRQALRMRPDRLVVGECRGGELADLLSALNTGHEGGAGTLTPTRRADVPARLEALGLLGGLPPPGAARPGGRRCSRWVCICVGSPGAGCWTRSACCCPTGPERLVDAVPAWRRGSGAGPGAPRSRRLLADRGVRPPALRAPVVPDEPGVAVGCVLAAAVLTLWPPPGRRARRRRVLAAVARPRADSPGTGGGRPPVAAGGRSAAPAGPARRRGRGHGRGGGAGGPVAGVVAAAYGALAAVPWCDTGRGESAARTAAACWTRSARPPPTSGGPAGHPCASRTGSGARPALVPRDRRQRGRRAYRRAAGRRLERIEADARSADRAGPPPPRRLAGSRATAWLLAGLPAGGIALGYAIGADPLAVLLHTPVGAACAVGARSRCSWPGWPGPTGSTRGART